MKKGLIILLSSFLLVGCSFTKEPENTKKEDQQQGQQEQQTQEQQGQQEQQEQHEEQQEQHEEQHEEEHLHTFSTDWSYDETFHWRQSTCEHDARIDFGKHQYDAHGHCVCGKAINVIYYTSKVTGTSSDGSTYFATYDYDVENRTLEIKGKSELEGQTVYEVHNKYVYNEKNLCTYTLSDLSYNNGKMEAYFEYDANDNVLRKSVNVNEVLTYTIDYYYDELNRLTKKVETHPATQSDVGYSVSDEYTYYDGYYIEKTTISDFTFFTKCEETINETLRTKTYSEYDIDGEEATLKQSVISDIESSYVLKVEGRYIEGYTTYNTNNDPLHFEYLGSSSISMDTKADFTYLEDGTLDYVLITEKPYEPWKDYQTSRLEVVHDEYGNVIEEKIYDLDDQGNKTLASTLNYEIASVTEGTFIPKDLNLAPRKGSYLYVNNGYFDVALMLENFGTMF